MYNLHTHTYRCNHAEGTEREYIESAISLGLKELGFSDHCPYFFDGDYYSHFRMRPNLTEDYVKTILDLKEEYKNDIKIHLGFEVEYYPKYFDKLNRFLSQFPIEYYILGQHFIGNEAEAGSFYSGNGKDGNEFLCAYVDQVIEAFKTECFTYLAHPDLVNFEGEQDFYIKEMTRLCKEAKKYKIPLEYNMLGLFYNRCYPNPVFWKIVKDVGADAVIGFDAHIKKPFTDIKYYKKCLDNLKSFGITPLEKVNLINPFKNLHP
ncbi:MAG: histidinol-phosphatase [Acutalibacteraceae bacterium]